MTRWAGFWCFGLALVVATLASRASAATREELLVQTQAADVLGGALTAAVAQASGEIDAAHTHSTTTAPGAGAVVRPTEKTRHFTYHELFDRTAARIKKQGESAIDPSLKNMPSGQLFDEMTTIQQYNIAQYLRLVHMLDEIHSSRIPTTMPTIESLGETTANAASNATWKKQRDELRYAVVARIINNNASARQQQQQQQQAGPNASASPAPAPGYVPGASDDPRWQPYFFGPQDALTGWSDVYTDPFAVHGGGGSYYRTDIRVNRDYDPRTNGVFDRRVNIESDRRLNIHTDPRENF